MNNHPPTNSIHNYGKHPATTSNDLIIYTKEELLQQKAELMDRVHTMKAKSSKLDSLIREEHHKLKECSRKLDLLKQKLMINFTNRPPEQLQEAATLCHKCDIWWTESSKNIDKKLDEPTKSNIQTGHPIKPCHNTTLQASEDQKIEN